MIFQFSQYKASHIYCMRCRGGAREMVLDMVFRFCCPNGGGRIYKNTGFAFDNLARKRAIQ